MGLLNALSSFVRGPGDANATRFETGRRLQAFLGSQIDILAREGLPVHINEITVGYVSHLVMLFTKKPMSLNDVHVAMATAFPDQSSLFMTANALQIFQGDVEQKVKLDALFPIAKAEYDAGEGEFLIRHSRQGKKAMEKMFIPTTEREDLSKSPRWTAKELA